MPSILTHLVMDQAVVAPALLCSLECVGDTVFFAKIRALYGENADKILVHVQSVIDLFAKQLNNALNLHYVYHQNTGVIRAIFHKCP